MSFQWEQTGHFHFYSSLRSLFRRKMLNTCMFELGIWISCFAHKSFALISKCVFVCIYFVSRRPHAYFLSLSIHCRWLYREICGKWFCFIYFCTFYHGAWLEAFWFDLFFDCIGMRKKNGQTFAHASLCPCQCGMKLKSHETNIRLA